jgi:hypothetical protein
LKKKLEESHELREAWDKMDFSVSDPQDVMALTTPLWSPMDKATLAVHPHINAQA